MFFKLPVTQVLQITTRQFIAAKFHEFVLGFPGENIIKRRIHVIIISKKFLFDRWNLLSQLTATYRWFLKGAGKGTFTAMPSLKSGFFIKGDVKDMEMVRLANGDKMILAAVNNDTMRAFKIRNAVN